MKKQIKRIRKIGILGNVEKPEAADMVRRAAELAEASGLEHACDVATARLAGLKGEFESPAKLARAVDLIIVFGGDGTILRVSRDIMGSATPVLGVNIGGLGFLTAVPSDRLEHALEDMLAGKYTIQSRALIEVSGRARGKAVFESALNDIVVSRGAVSRLISLDVSADGEMITRYRCDGLIISSPTGSTAYSLAAGGAVVLPTAEVFTLTPICPHSLSNRSIILPLSAKISVKAAPPSPATILSVDGQVVAEMNVGDEVVVRRSRRSMKLVQLADGSFLEALRRKLHWRGTYV